MVENIPWKEKREFYRYTHEKPIKYRVIINKIEGKHRLSKILDAISKNLSASGMLFTSKHLPEISSILIVDLDYKTSLVCQEIEENALIVNDRLLGKVVRIEDNDDGSYDIGIAFVKKSDILPSGIKNLIK